MEGGNNSEFIYLDDDFEEDVEVVNMDRRIERPCAGMLFEEMDAIFEFYKRYAKARGFSVRKEYKGRDTNGVHKYQRFTCHRAGKAVNSGKDSLRPTVSQRIGCKARICCSLQNDGQWHINTFVDDHNHEMTP